MPESPPETRTLGAMPIMEDNLRDLQVSLAKEHAGVGSASKTRVQDDPAMFASGMLIASAPFDVGQIVCKDDFLLVSLDVDMGFCFNLNLLNLGL